MGFGLTCLIVEVFVTKLVWYFKWGTGRLLTPSLYTCIGLYICIRYSGRFSFCQLVSALTIAWVQYSYSDTPLFNVSQGFFQEALRDVMRSSVTRWPSFRPRSWRNTAFLLTGYVHRLRRRRRARSPAPLFWGNNSSQATGEQFPQFLNALWR